MALASATTVIDDCRWRHANATITAPSSTIVDATSSAYHFRLHYVDVPHSGDTPRGTVLLIHGFPETWYQWRHTINPFSQAGYRVIVPDYRGAGNSQAPPSNAGFAGGKGGGYTKLQLADDLHTLVCDTLGIREKVHVIGHDIGAMVAHAYASWFSEGTASLVWIDCPVPGSRFYHEVKTQPVTWHFAFHSVEDDLPEKLVQGNERLYIRHFFDRLSVNPWALQPGGDAEDAYVLAYSRPGALRAAFDAYRTFEEDGRQNIELVKKQGKSKVPTLAIAGEGSFNNPRQEEQLEECHENVEKRVVSNSGHWVVEENPKEFLKTALAWLDKHPVKL